ncbi:MAG: hypothetical protein QM762_08750 [Chryseolinea sp.]
MPCVIASRDVLPTMAAFDDVVPGFTFNETVYFGSHVGHWTGYKVPDGAAIYNMEPLYDGCRSLSIGYMDILRRTRVLDYSASNVAYLARQGIEAFHLPYGFHTGLIDEPRKARKDIEVLLIGSDNPRRRAIVSRLRRVFHVKWLSGVYGEARAQAAARAHVQINVHFCDEHLLEITRLNWLMANGHNVVSEPGNEPEVNDAYAAGLRLSFDLEGAIADALLEPIDGSSVIRGMPINCEAANRWLAERKVA